MGTSIGGAEGRIIQHLGLLAVLLGATNAPAAEHFACDPPTKFAARASAARDGGILALADGGELRLAGIVPGPADGGIGETTHQVLNALAAGHDLELATTARKGPTSDRHGRLVAQVFVKRDGERLWLQGALVSQGLALAYAVKDGEDCMAALIAAEDAARTRQVGFWRDGTFAVRAAYDIRKLESVMDTLQIVTGRVLSVGEARDQTFLNFGPVWKKDFTVVIPARIARQLGETGVRLQDLRGYRVRIRGYLQRRGGPAIILEAGSHLEVLGR